ncbi:hypothetical protein [Actinomyces sp. 565]|nr:hypothetical protein [Actinomyces sp. 565]
MFAVHPPSAEEADGSCTGAAHGAYTGGGPGGHNFPAISKVWWG